MYQSSDWIEQIDSMQSPFKFQKNQLLNFIEKFLPLGLEPGTSPVLSLYAINWAILARDGTGMFLKT